MRLPPKDCRKKTPQKQILRNFAAPRGDPEKLGMAYYPDYTTPYIIGKPMTLSVIVPVYNAERFIGRCIDSLLAQGLEAGEYEIILVNDGSRDSSLDICRRYQEEHPDTVRVISQENQGVCAARNTGITNAKGDWVAFADNDDYVIPGGYRYLIDHFLDDSIDILSFKHLLLNKKTKRTFVENNDVTGKVYLETEGIEFLKHSNNQVIWTSLYKRKFLSKHGLLFRPELRITEDMMFNVDVYLKNPKIRFVSSCLYRYDFHDGNTVNRRDYKFMRMLLGAYMIFMRQMAKYIKENSANPQLCKGLKNLVDEHIVYFIIRLLLSDYTVSEFKKVKKELTNIHILPPPKEKSIQNLLVRIVFATPYLLPLYEWGYQKIIIPYVVPRFRRN